MLGKTEYGEGYRAVELDPEDPYELKRRVPTRGPWYSAPREAVHEAVALVRAGRVAKVEYLPDGRSGHMGGPGVYVSHDALAEVVDAARG